MIPEFCTRPKHDFTHLGWVDGWLGRTLESSALHCWGLRSRGGGGGGGGGGGTAYMMGDTYVPRF